MPDESGREWTFRADCRALWEVKRIFGQGSIEYFVGLYERLRREKTERTYTLDPEELFKLAWAFSGGTRDDLQWEARHYTALEIGELPLDQTLAYRKFLSELPCPGSPGYTKLKAILLDLADRIFRPAGNDDPDPAE